MPLCFCVTLLMYRTFQYCLWLVPSLVRTKINISVEYILFWTVGVIFKLDANKPSSFCAAPCKAFVNSFACPNKKKQSAGNNSGRSV